MAKPIIIYTTEDMNKNNEITLTKERLEEIVAQAYNAGFEDGSKTSIISSPIPTYPSWKDNGMTYCNNNPTTITSNTNNGTISSNLPYKPMSTRIKGL